MYQRLSLITIFLLATVACGGKNPSSASSAQSESEAVESAASQEVNIYSARKEALILPVLERFTEQTGIKVNLLTGNADALISRSDELLPLLSVS